MENDTVSTTTETTTTTITTTTTTTESTTNRQVMLQVTKNEGRRVNVKMTVIIVFLFIVYVLP